MLNTGKITARSLEIGSGSTFDLEGSDHAIRGITVENGGSSLGLGAAVTLTDDLYVYGSGATAATVDAQGNDITADQIRVGYIGNRGALLNTGKITARSLEIGSGSTFDLEGGDDTIGGIRVEGAGSTLNLAADLNLAEDLYIFGSSTTAATVNAQGNNITADQVRVGYIGSIGALLDDGALTAQDLTIQDNSSVILTGGDDVITRNLTLDDGGALTIAQAMGELTGLTLDGTSLAIDGSSLLTLAFDDVLVAGLDWAFRWANPTGGDRVAALLDFVSAGRITWTAPWGVSVFDHGDGYTYIGYTDAQVPEPAGIGLATLLAGAGWLGWRRRRASMVCRSALAKGRAGFAAAA